MLGGTTAAQSERADGPVRARPQSDLRQRVTQLLQSSGQLFLYSRARGVGGGILFQPLACGAALKRGDRNRAL